jgi:hypothetical protein
MTIDHLGHEGVGGSGGDWNYDTDEKKEIF